MRFKFFHACAYCGFICQSMTTLVCSPCVKMNLASFETVKPLSCKRLLAKYFLFFFQMSYNYLIGMCHDSVVFVRISVRW